jgi:hypothetical protein
MMALKKKDAKEAVKQITAANTLLDTWIGRFELGRAYDNAECSRLVEFAHTKNRLLS